MHIFAHDLTDGSPMSVREDRGLARLCRYCKFGNFRENFIFASSVKRQICDVKNREQGMIYLYQ